MRRHLFVLVLLAAPITAFAQRPARSVTPGAAGEERFVDSVLALMTVEDKVGQLNQKTGPPESPQEIELFKRGGIGVFLNVIGVDATRRVQKMAIDETRLHIPVLFGFDVIHGYRTTFPVPLAEASSWDPATAERTARVAGMEAAAGGIHWTFAPMVDIARDPRWGRVVEGAGEDPYLGSAFAAARVRGFQGNGMSDVTAVAATAKHYAGYGAAEGGRDYNTAELSERTLRDVYLPPFHAAACAGAQTFMAGFNDIAGIPDHANRQLMTSILRGEWLFNGTVVSDWTGIGELLEHGVGPDTASVAALALNAGVDIDMVSQVYLHGLPALVRTGQLPRATLDEAVRRVLRLKYRLGLFKDPYRGSNPTREQQAMLTAESRALAREAARRSIVLLKNDNTVLPLRKDLRAIAVVGALAADSQAAVGNWQGLGRAEDAISVLTGLRRAVSSATAIRYARGASPVSDDTSGIAEAVAATQGADAVIVVVGETPDMSAEAESRASLDLPGAQLALVRAVQAVGVPTVVVLMNGRPLATQWLQDHVPAILETWFLGGEHGNATADVLFGDFNPSGRLPISVPRVTGQVPIYYAHRNTGRPPAANNKYTSKYWDVPWTPLYPFGYGLSYTTYTYGTPRITSRTMRPGDTLRVEVDVTNSGRVAGDETVQLYIRDMAASIARPVRELRGFQQAHLGPGEKKTVSFPIRLSDLAFYDVNLRRVAEPGAFRVYVGGSSMAAGETGFALQTTGNRAVPVASSCADMP